MTAHQPSLVLIVDDEPKNLQVVGSLLRDKGYDVVFATNGPEALDALRLTPPDLVLLDVMMPDMDGYEVCRRIKQNPLTRKIPVIFLTAKSETEDIVRGFREGGVDYVTKPFRAEELLARVHTHVQLFKLKDLIPICMYCHKIRQEAEYWERIEEFLAREAGADLTHSICPECFQKIAADSGLQ
jgi:CheY-like chemotaxis protein